ncbi:MAG: hemolysin III family protein [Planctomycetaceae bacterium]|nr:hemolysin III family protein [Planctomycetaceae bacterium]
MHELVQQRTRLSESPEETLNQITHGAGLALSIVGAYRLLSLATSDTWLKAGCWIYAAALVALYAASTLSHSWVSGPLRHRYRTLDQICIFAVMAATYTPVSLYACRDGWWNTPLILMWLMAGLGTWLKLRVTGREMVPVWFYVLMGWLPMLALPRIQQTTGSDGLFWIVSGGACYMLGVVFLSNDRRVPYFHAVWHLLVIMGSVCHYIAIHNSLATPM